MRTATVFATSFILTASASVIAQDATYTTLTELGGVADMTPDGSIIIGPGAGGGTIYDVALGTYTGIGGQSVSGVSDDGSVVLGNISAKGLQTAAIWNADKGWIPIGGLGETCGSLSSGFDLTSDGAQGCGLGWDSCSGRGFWWHRAAGMYQLETLGQGGNRASVISSCGSVMGGFAQGSFSRTPARWTSSLDGELLDPPNGDAVGEVLGMSDDGKILVGTWDQQAFKWTEEGGVELLGNLNPGWSGNASDIADDGTIVGYDIQPPFDREAWILPPGGEITRLSDYLTDLGATGVPSLIEFALRISTDGTVISGSAGAFPFSNGFVATVPGFACDSDLNGDGDVGFIDLTQILADWGPCPGSEK